MDTIYAISDKGYLFAIHPTGSLIWTFVASSGYPFKYSPLVSQSGMVYIASEDNRVYVVSPSGLKKYEFITNSKIKARPALALNGDLYVPAENGRLYSLAQDGSLRFVFSVGGDHFRSSPVLSTDGLTLYSAVEEGYLLALNTSNGTEKWRFATAGKIKDSPALDFEGNLILGSEGKDLNVLARMVR